MKLIIFVPIIVYLLLVVFEILRWKWSHWKNSRRLLTENKDPTLIPNLRKLLKQSEKEDKWNSKN